MDHGDFGRGPGFGRNFPHEDRKMTSLQFQPITLAGQKAYARHLAACPQVASDYSFINLWGWAEAFGLKWVLDESAAWICQTRPATKLWAPVGAWDEPAFEKIGELLRGRDMIRVPEILAKALEKHLGNKIEAVSDRANWDYVYPAKDLAELSGKRFHNKKNLLNQFLKKYEFTFRKMGPDLAQQALGLQQNWCLWRDCESVEVLRAENRMIQKVLENWDKLSGLMGGALFVGDEMAAYTIAEGLGKDTLVIHVEKGNPEFKGVYQAVNQMFVQSVKSQAAWINREQDLGDDGLRKAKMSYNPARFIEKYQIRAI